MPEEDLSKACHGRSGCAGTTSAHRSTSSSPRLLSTFCSEACAYPMLLLLPFCMGCPLSHGHKQPTKGQCPCGLPVAPHAQRVAGMMLVHRHVASLSTLLASVLDQVARSCAGGGGSWACGRGVGGAQQGGAAAGAGGQAPGPAALGGGAAAAGGGRAGGARACGAGAPWQCLAFTRLWQF